MNYFGRKSLLNNLDGKIIHVYLTKNHLDIIEKLKLKNIKYSIIDQSYFNSFDQNLNHQGIHTVIESRVNFESITDYLENTTGARTVLMIDSITDPFNFGSIIRTSEFFGVDLIIYKKDNQVQINDFVIKTSMGAINNINMLKVTNLAATIDILKKYGYWIYSSTLNDKAVDSNAVEFDDKTVIIVGNEDKGISKIVLDKSDFFVKIPSGGSTQSLNVAVATGILISEIKREKRRKIKNN